MSLTINNIVNRCALSKPTAIMLLLFLSLYVVLKMMIFERVKMSAQNLAYLTVPTQQ